MQEQTITTKTIKLSSGQQVTVEAEVSIAEAAQILGVDKKTIRSYLQGGYLAWRDIAPPKSSRPTFRIKLESVIRLRTDYQAGAANTPPSPPPRKPRRPVVPYTSKHIKLRDD
jgi:hypothetical protein